jgi:TonB family protein
MKRLMALLWLLPLCAQAQTTVTEGNPNAPALLIRLNDGGQDCFRYPGMVTRPEAGGGVTLSYTVNTDGGVSNVAITSPSGDIQIDRTATDCAKSWKFVPPRKDGQPTTITATAIMAFAGRIFHWQTPLVREASSIGLTDIQTQGLKCLRAQRDLAPLAAGTTLSTYLQIIFFRGEISRVKLISPPGNDTLDKAAIACYSAVPKNEQRAVVLDKTDQVTFTLPWRTLFQPAGTR